MKTLFATQAPLMRLPAVLLAVATMLCSAPAVAQEHRTLGFGRFLTNDVIDQEDRWRTGGLTLNWVRGTEWTGQLPSRPFDILEYRFRANLITPADTANPAPGDRLFAGTLSFGLHTHFDWNGTEVSAGVDLAEVGEQTGLRNFQRSLHDRFGWDPVTTGPFEIEDQWLLHATVEFGREYNLGFGRLRPFAEVQSGLENLARVGADLTIGEFGRGALMLRDVNTGQRYVGVRSEDPSGLSLILGADAAWVESSVYLPESLGYEIEPFRGRLRAGVATEIGPLGVFAGATYLTEEFVGQPEGQVLSSVNITFNF
ncbi:DUF2219 family protein [Rhodobacterales bacterium HKCCE2091]|nr:DUF2219 family protein [Rhodobacterales bacterium HKCCE2091]